MSGSIPISLGNLSNLESLDLSFNQLSGSIPSSLGALSNLVNLWLRENQLSGSIPISLGNLSNLQVLSLSAGNDELCAPNDEAFQAWLKNIGELRWTGPTCSGAGLAPADQAAFDSLAVGKQIVNADSGDRLIFLSPGRVREFDQGESYDGDYRYENTGENTGTLTYTYDVTGNNPTSKSR